MDAGRVSPLGKYSQIVAAIIAVGVIGAAVLSRPLGFADDFVDNAALIALGAIFGSFATVNGIRSDITAAHKRLDTINAPPADNGSH